MILNDTAIKRLAREQGMIAPFTTETVRILDERAIISYGLTGHGYDLRLSPRDFRKFIPVKGAVDPKSPDPNMTKPLLLEHDDQGSFFTMPPHSYCLGVAMEKLRLPDNIAVLCMTKSTYARAGISINTTPVNAGWEGHLTLEFANQSPSAVRVYAGEGVVHLFFLEGATAEHPYQSSRYQGQPESVVMGSV